MSPSPGASAGGTGTVDDVVVEGRWGGYMDGMSMTLAIVDLLMPPDVGDDGVDDSP